MKTAGLKSEICAGGLLALFMFGKAFASWNISVDGDLRYENTDWHENSAEVKALGASVRKIFSDQKGDRVILFGFAEARDNFSDLMIHELYARYKGPLGKWTVTGGRFTLQYGLLSSFSADRFLYETTYKHVIGFDADNGIQLSGVLSSFDYALSVTQGYGHHHKPDFKGHGLGVARLGLTLGETDENKIGISGMYGKTSSEHSRDHALPRAVAGLDGTVNIGRLSARAEVTGGFIDDHIISAGFVSGDFAVSSMIELNTALSLVKIRKTYEDDFFFGISFRPRWLTIRGGYTYGYFSEPHHRISLQAYRRFDLTF